MYFRRDGMKKWTNEWWVSRRAGRQAKVRYGPDNPKMNRLTASCLLAHLNMRVLRISVLNYEKLVMVMVGVARRLGLMLVVVCGSEVI